MSTHVVPIQEPEGVLPTPDSNIRPHEPYHPYRVRGIPANAKNSTLRKLLKDILHEDNLVVRIRSLAVDAYNPQYKVATVVFPERPKCLVSNKSSWSFLIVPEMNSEDEDIARDEEIVIDTHFHGFTALNSFEDTAYHLIESVILVSLFIKNGMKRS